ncbi:hypothetical protein BDN71DRAFT_1444154 [Pleurotus eryngii]|uniref:Uncharacterized protein n=1 Tax=Pleurotus eryngii TaxID=5323 RepID=A0A9P6DIG3_PLEER|nr:hypothetical protein BDN71DRAFT_1444154 [Pleurotus eryngii]
MYDSNVLNRIYCSFPWKYARSVPNVNSFEDPSDLLEGRRDSLYSGMLVRVPIVDLSYNRLIIGVPDSLQRALLDRNHCSQLHLIAIVNDRRL